MWYLYLVRPKTEDPRLTADAVSRAGKTEADFSGGYTTKGSVPLRFYLRVRNLMDSRYSTVNGYPDFGRLLDAGVQLKFSKEKD